MKILIASFSHESNTFAKYKTLKDKFGITYGKKIVERHRNVRSYLGGMIVQADKLPVELVPTISIGTGPSGTIEKKTFESLRDEFIEKITAEKDIDAICLSLHGGGVAEGYSDIEGEILSKLRAKVDQSIPIISTLDLHANLSEKMVENATALLGVNHYPHTDMYDRGEEAMQLTYDIVQEKVNPVMKMKKIPLLVFPSTSYQSPVKDINEYCWDIEKNKDIIDCTFFHGFARADIPETGASVLTITNDNDKLCEKVNDEVSQRIWKDREAFSKEFPSPSEAIEQALTYSEGPIVINETSDNPGSGAPGDGTYLLRSLLEKNPHKTAFGFMTDPEVVEKAFAAGVGKVIDVELGGKTDELHGSPVEVTAYVKSLTDGQFIRTTPMGQGGQANYGKSVRLVIGQVDVIVCTRKAQTTDEQIFLLHGINVHDYNIIALKSAQHFRAAFQPIAKEIITSDSPGTSTSNPKFYDYKNVKRPIYPLDPSCPFE